MQILQRKIITFSFIVLLLVGCAKSDNFSLPTLDCLAPTLTPNTTLEQLQLQADATIQLYPGQANDVLTGVVISSDQGGNFYNKLHLVDEITQVPAIVNLEMGASYTAFPPGTKVAISLSGLYYSNAFGKLNIGGGIYTSSTGKKYIGSLAKNAINTTIQKYCEPLNLDAYTTKLSLATLKQEIETYTSRLVLLENVQFDRKLVGKTLYDPKEVDAQGYTLRKMVDQNGNSIYIRTGKLTKDFVDYVIPAQSGTIIGIADVFSKQIQFYPRVLEDFNFDQPPFEAETTEEEEEEQGSLLIVVEPGQTLVFPGADFENWEQFLGVLKRPGLKFATQVMEEGWNNSTGLAFRGAPTKTENAFTIAQVQVPSNATAISFLLKGTANAKSLSIYLYQADGAYVAFNLENVTTSKIVSPTSITNQQGNVNKYKGTIDTQGEWVKIILPLQGVRYNTTGEGDFLTFRFGGKTATIPSTYNLVLDEIRFEESSME